MKLSGTINISHFTFSDSILMAISFSSFFFLLLFSFFFLFGFHSIAFVDRYCQARISHGSLTSNENEWNIEHKLWFTREFWTCADFRTFSRLFKTDMINENSFSSAFLCLFFFFLLLVHSLIYVCFFLLLSCWIVGFCIFFFYSLRHLRLMYEWKQQKNCVYCENNNEILFPCIQLIEENISSRMVLNLKQKQKKKEICHPHIKQKSCSIFVKSFVLVSLSVLAIYALIQNACVCVCACVVSLHIFSSKVFVLWFRTVSVTRFSFRFCFYGNKIYLNSFVRTKTAHVCVCVHVWTLEKDTHNWSLACEYVIMPLYRSNAFHKMSIHFYRLYTHSSLKSIETINLFFFFKRCFNITRSAINANRSNRMHSK